MDSAANLAHRAMVIRSLRTMAPLLVLALLCAAAWWLIPAPHASVAERLAAFVQQEAVWDNRFDQQIAKANSLLADLKSETDPVKRIELQREAARHFVLGGQAEGAIALLRQLIEDSAASAPAASLEALKADLALAYLRSAELQNCAWNHNADSCLFPLRGGGVHQRQLGVNEAIKLWEELLADPVTDPNAALGYRWLLNIGYMALGQHPAGVPPQWLIKPEVFASPHDIGRFKDIAIEKSVTAFGLAGGAIMDDFDNDGHLDLFTSSWGLRDPLQFFRNRGDGSFENLSAKAGLEGITGGLQTLQADYNGDGLLDVLVLRGAWLHNHGKLPRSLLRNNGNNTFTDVTFEAGLTGEYPTQAAAWADYDNDGQLDLIIGNELARAQVSWPAEAKNFELYRNTGGGHFSEVGVSSGIRLNAWIKGIAWGDYDNDGWQDLYVSVLGGPNHLFRNLGAKPGALPQFEDVTFRAGVEQPFMSFPCWFWDFDNDGWLDIFVSGYSADLPAIARAALGEQGPRGETPRLYRNNHNGSFTDMTAELKLDQPLLTMGSNFGDLDNDGWPDMYLGTGAPGMELLIPNRMFHNHGGQFFDDVTTAGGTGHLQKGHGVAWGDVDNDGDQDIYEDIGGAFDADGFWNVLFENPGHPGHHWITLRLTGVKANRFGVGARIRVRVKNTHGGTRDIHHLAGSGGSFGANSLQAEIGLGAARAIESIEVRWPGSGLTQSFTAPAMDRIYRLTEGSATLTAP